MLAQDEDAGLFINITTDNDAGPTTKIEVVKRGTVEYFVRFDITGPSKASTGCHYYTTRAAKISVLRLDGSYLTQVGRSFDASYGVYGGYSNFFRPEGSTASHPSLELIVDLALAGKTYADLYRELGIPEVTEDSKAKESEYVNQCG